MSASPAGAARLATARQNGPALKVGIPATAPNTKGDSTVTSNGGNMSALLLRRQLLRHQRVEHPMQVRGRQLDVGMLVLTRARFGSTHGTAMNIAKIAIGDPVAALATFSFLIVLPKMPFPEFGQAVSSDELLLCMTRGPVVGPVSPLVEQIVPITDELLGVLIGTVVQLH